MRVGPGGPGLDDHCTRTNVVRLAVHAIRTVRSGQHRGTFALEYPCPVSSSRLLVTASAETSTWAVAGTSVATTEALAPPPITP